MHPPSARLAIACLTAIAAAARGDLPTQPPAATIPADIAAFQQQVSPAILSRRPASRPHWLRVEPAVHRLACAHADRLAALDDEARLDALAALAGFIDARRDAAGPTPVLARQRTVIGLLDPTHGLDSRQITAISTAYGCDPVTVFKQDAPGETIESVAAEFLAAVRAATAASAPTSIIVLGHGLPTEIQSYHIPVERFADTLFDGAAEAAGPDAAIDLGQMVIVCDDCFSADFLAAVCAAVEARCRDRGRRLGSLPACIAGTDHGRFGHAADGEKFVPFFWSDVIELFFIRRPHPKAVTLRHVFDNVDAMMYGRGRAPIMDGTTITGWKLVNPDLVQDPVIFVPLAEDDLTELRRILDLPADASLPRWLEIG